MHGENGTPVTPDWIPCEGNRCAGCGGSANLCHTLAHVAPDYSPCCEMCTHVVEVVVQTWDGDNA